MSSFSYENKNDKLYLTYVADVSEIIDGYTLGIVINNPLVGIAQTLFSNDENGKKFTYDITGTMSLKELMKKGIDEKLYVCLLASVSTTLHNCEQYGLNIGSLILNEELIYCNEEKGLVYFICIPTSGYVSSIETKELLGMFSNVLINRMEVTNNTILEINEYLVANPEYVYADFIYKINEYFVANNINMPGVVQEKTRQTLYKVEPEKTRKPENKKLDAENVNEADNMLSMQHQSGEHLVEENVSFEIGAPVVNTPVMPNQVVSAPVITNSVETTPVVVAPRNNMKVKIKDKVAGISRAIGNLKNTPAIKNVKAKVSGLRNKNSVANQNNVADQNNMVAQNNMAQVCDQNMYVVSENQNNHYMEPVQNNKMYQVEQEIENTLMLDCVTGETEGNNSISTAEPYLIRVSTGEKISINRSNFKLGRSRKNADYCVMDNDTISKVHAYIIVKANQYFIVDNASSNRTYLDGKVIKPIEENRLSHESKIKLAKEEFVFYLY